MVGRADLPALLGDWEAEVIWLDCWESTRDYVLRQGSAYVAGGGTAVWYAPGVGVVRLVEVSVELDGETVSRTQDLVDYSH